MGSRFYIKNLLGKIYLGYFQKSGVQRIVISLKEIKTRKSVLVLVDLRTYLKNLHGLENKPDYIPTSKGISIDLRNWEEFFDILTKINNQILLYKENKKKKIK